LENNRTTKQDYFGNITGQFISNVISPITNHFKQEKKVVEHPNPSGFMSITAKKPVTNPYQSTPTTNREMTSESKGHLNVQGQSSNIYIHSNPYMNHTQRQSTSHSIMGGANGSAQFKSYDAEYNQRNIQKPYENRTANGNMKLYNGDINASINGHEQCNTRTNALYVPKSDSIMGEMTKQNQSYELPAMDNSILKAFKENPYTHSLSSVA